MRRLRTPFALSIAALLLVTATAAAASFTLTPRQMTIWDTAATVAACSSPGSQTVTANKDTYVDQSAPASGFATSTDLFVQSKPGSANRRTLVQFALPATPSGCTVTAATLRMSNTAGTTGRTIQALRVNAAWSESVTWNTQPATTGTAATAASSTTVGWRTWNVTSIVQAMYGGTNNGFLLRDSAESAGSGPQQKYESRENTNDPQLVVTFG